MSVELKDYFEALKKHDWYFENSDDRSVFSKGRENQKLLERIANQKDGNFRKMFNDFSEHYFTGEPWGTVKTTMPKLKDYGVSNA